MYEPNSVRGLLNLSKGDPLEQESTASDLIAEMDEFIANLQNWREQRKQLDAEIQSIPKPSATSPVDSPDPNDEIPTLEPMEVNYEALTAVQSQRVDIEALTEDPRKRAIGGVSLPEADFRSSDLYEIGQKLKAELQLPSDLDMISGTVGETTHSGEAWRAVDEIEKELEDLERELEAVNIKSPWRQT